MSGANFLRKYILFKSPKWIIIKVDFFEAVCQPAKRRRTYFERGDSKG